MPTLTRKKPEEKDPALKALQDQIDGLFEASRNQLRREQETVFPSVDISEDKDTLYIKADIPGFEQKDLSISIREGRLVLSARKEACAEEPAQDRSRGELYREIVLPSSVDVGRVKAAYRNGVLKIAIPKKEEAKGSEITVNVG